MRENLSSSRTLLSHAWKDKRSRLARWSLIILMSVALLADFLANDKPLYAKINGDVQFPAIQSLLSSFGLTKKSLAQDAVSWKTQEYEAVLFAPVPYSPSESDLRNANFKSPFGVQNVKSARFRHWLGTDHLGRDVLSGLIHGSRIALLVGVCSILLAALLGIPAGAFIGFFGDDRFRMRIHEIIICILCTLLVVYFIVVAISATGPAVWMSLILALSIIAISIGLKLVLRRWRPHGKSIRIPIDTLALRAIEIIRSIPAFFLLFAVLGMVRTPRMIYVILLIAVLWSPSILRFVRAEALKLRKQTFIQSAKVIGLSDFKIVIRHIIPNAIGPALITIAFGIGSAVLIESGLSFLGIGIAPDTVTWGKMLNVARSNFSAWWMALLPGIAIFMTIAIFNRLGDVLESHISGR